MAKYPDTLYPIEDLHEDDGLCLLWQVPIEGPPILIHPLDDDYDEVEWLKEHGYTHFSHIVCPANIVVAGISMSYEYWEENLQEKK